MNQKYTQEDVQRMMAAIPRRQVVLLKPETDVFSLRPDDREIIIIVPASGLHAHRAGIISLNSQGTGSTLVIYDPCDGSVSDDARKIAFDLMVDRCIPCSCGNPLCNTNQLLSQDCRVVLTGPRISEHWDQALTDKMFHI